MKQQQENSRRASEQKQAERLAADGRQTFVQLEASASAADWTSVRGSAARLFEWRCCSCRLVVG